ncbi:fumarate hydratase C-terminal domain-containing protein, partial [Salmonella enterica]|uniref:fumarate hydratase C-terminal domain-containing protein n=1 Tax=Salmonella enterica TaxID=28901 RepID=UPI001F3BFBBC
NTKRPMMFIRRFTDKKLSTYIRTSHSIGGPAAVLAQQSIKHLECVEYPELGMEAIWKIEVEDFPAFILVDDKGNDFFQQIVSKQCANCAK